MSYKAFSHKSLARKKALRAEYTADTGRVLYKEKDDDRIVLMYRGYSGTAGYDIDASCYTGEVDNIRDVVTLWAEAIIPHCMDTFFFRIRHQ